MKRVLAVAALTSLLATACGSTVQVKGTATVGDGLTASGQQQGGALGGTSGSATSGNGTSGGGTTGSGATSGTALTTGGSSATGGTGQSAPGSTTGRLAGGPSAVPGIGNHAPIKIGFVTTSVGNADSLGVNAGQSYPDQSMFEALVRDYNAHGGLAGHKIVPVYGGTDTASSNWANQFAAVCAKFTQDNHVQAVIGYIFVFLHSFESCLAKAQVPHLYGGYQPGDLTDQAQYPLLAATGNPSVDGAFLTPLVGALQSGLLTGKTKLGIMLNTCADGDRAYARTVEPWLKAHRVNFQTVLVNCAQGSTDVSSAASSISSAELRFASSGVDLVYSSDVSMLVFMEDAQSQNYHPQYLTGIGGAALQANAPASQMQNLHGFGWMPSIDVDQLHQPYPKTASQTACIGRLTRQGLRPSQYNDFMAAYQACDGLELYAKALASGASQPSQVVAAVRAATPSFASNGTYGGSLTWGDHQHGGAGKYRAYAWDSSCSCVTYRGPVLTLPTP